MKRTPLPDLIERIGQSAVAKGLSVSAPALTKAVKAGRVIYVIEGDDGSMAGEEIRPFPSQSAASRETA